MVLLSATRISFICVTMSQFRWQMMDALEEDPNLYKGLILNSFSNGFEFVDLGNFKPAAGPPMQNLAM